MKTTKEVSISLRNNTEKEQVAKRLLETILEKYSLDKWILCNEVVIEEGASGKAFPIIRLSVWRDKEDGMLAQFIHEQYHWIERGHEETMIEAMDELRKIFPNAPIEKPEGGGSDKSTYVHLIVCRLEFLGLKEILGEDRAFALVSGNSNYTWIRKMALDRGSEIDRVIMKYFPESIKH